MQSYSSLHKVRITINWLRDKEIEVLEWRVYSLTLNPIEHLRDLLKKAYHKAETEIMSLPHGVEEKRYLLVGVLSYIWADMDQNIDSMLRKMTAVFGVKGTNTKYQILNVIFNSLLEYLGSTELYALF